MNKQDVFEAWAPGGGDWSAWAKPVLFAHLDHVPRLESPGADAVPYDLSWVPRPGQGEDSAALVIDLPDC